MAGFFLVIFSAFTHSSWNALLKKANNKFIFNYQMHIVNFIVFTIMYPIFFSDKLYFDMKSILFGFIAALFFTLYHLSLSNSYTYTDVSLVYPITTSSPLLVVIWARLILGEQVTWIGLLGIIIIITGVIVINSTKIKGRLDNKGLIYAFFAAFFYSLGAIVDKFGVDGNNFIQYIYSLVFFMTLFLTIQAKLKHNNHIDEFKKNRKLVLLGGVIIFLSFFSYRLGLTFMQVSYATSLRQVNAVFGVLIGFYLLNERISFKRLAGAFIIFIGAFLIKFTL